MTPIRILLAEDHALVRAGFRSLLHSFSGVEVVGEANDGREALRLIEVLRPNIVLMDIMMPGLNGLEATARVTKEFPSVRVIILSMNAAEEYVDDMFSGKKEHLRPLYDALLKLGLSIGKDVKACPCQTIVPLYRNHVFAQIKPTTQTRIDFGLALGDMKKTPKRLINTGGFEKKDRITHRFEIASLKDIDDELKRWLRVAYDRDA